MNINFKKDWRVILIKLSWSNDTFVGCQWFNVNLQLIRFQYGRKKIQDHDSKYNTDLAEESTATENTETVKDKNKESEDPDDDSEDEDPGGFCVKW